MFVSISLKANNVKVLVFLCLLYYKIMAIHIQCIVMLILIVQHNIRPTQ